MNPSKYFTHLPPPATATAQDSNPLNVLPVAPRFQYLPISAPTATLAAQQQQQQQQAAAAAAAAVAATGGGYAAAAGAAAGLVPVTSSGSLAGARFRASVGALNRAVSGQLAAAGDAADSYSFADLGSARGGMRGGAAGGGVAGGGAGAEAPSAAAAGSAASVGAAALSALQARLQVRASCSSGTVKAVI